MSPETKDMNSPGTKTIDIRSALKQGIHLLRDAKVPSYTLAAELLLLHATGQDRTQLYSQPESILSIETAENYFSLIHRRASGEPTQHLTGKQEFWGLEFTVTPEVLIPRPETEHLIEVALDRLAVRELRAGRPQRLNGENLTILDVGTGSGCIAIALAKELPAAQIFASDVSAAALAVAQGNAKRLGYSNRIEFQLSNLLATVGARYILPQDGTDSTGTPMPSTVPVPAAEIPFFDVIISNPPYISQSESASLAKEVRDHEPPSALYGGEEGYELYGALIPEAARHLKCTGLLVLELGHDSLPAVRPLLDTPHWTNIGVTNDLAGIPRVLSAERTEHSL